MKRRTPPGSEAGSQKAQRSARPSDSIVAAGSAAAKSAAEAGRRLDPSS
jgi:hypothetical protein